MSLLAINIENLEYFYRNHWTGRKIRALNPFSLQVHAGECFGFLGNNGAGKTTTIKLILSLIKAYKGQISIFGLSSLNPESRGSLGYVSEQPYFYDHLTVFEIVEMYAALAPVHSKYRKKLVLSALEKLKIEGRAKTPMRALSKGLIQRVAIAQAICHNPRLLVLDEPFSGLDPVGRKEIRDLFAELRDKGTTIFMSSHILSDVESLCSRVSIMARGELKGVFDLSDKERTSPKGFELTFSSTPNLDQRIIKDLGGQQLNHPASVRLIFKDRLEAENALKKSFQHGLKLEKFEPAFSSLEELYVGMVNDNSAENKL